MAHQRFMPPYGPYHATLTEQLTDQDKDWSQRSDEVVARYYQAQAAFQQAKEDHAALQLEYDLLKGVIRAYKEIITHLLPYYPLPLPHELQHKLDVV